MLTRSHINSWLHFERAIEKTSRIMSLTPEAVATATLEDREINKGTFKLLARYWMQNNKHSHEETIIKTLKSLQCTFFKNTFPLAFPYGNTFPFPLFTSATRYRRFFSSSYNVILLYNIYILSPGQTVHDSQW